MKYKYSDSSVLVSRTNARADARLCIEAVKYLIRCEGIGALVTENRSQLKLSLPSCRSLKIHCNLRRRVGALDGGQVLRIVTDGRCDSS